MAQESYWGDLSDLATVKAPVAFLREQANVLSDATNNVLRGDVSSNTRRRAGARVMYHELDIVAPALNDYRYSVLTVYHDPVSLYPLRLNANIDDETIECHTEEAFLAQLKRILSSSTVRRVIETLLAQSKE